MSYDDVDRFKELFEREKAKVKSLTAENAKRQDDQLRLNKQLGEALIRIAASEKARLSEKERDVDQETPCPVREDKIHCVCWWEGEACCGCGDGPSTQRKEKYLICDKCLCVVKNHKGLGVFHSC